jgi:hypothetical protein
MGVNLAKMLQVWPDIHVLFRAPPGGAGDFSLFGQREVTKRKATPVLRFSSIHGRKIRAGRPGLPTRRPWRGGKWAQSLAPTLRAFSSGPHRSTGARFRFDDGHRGLVRSKIQWFALSDHARGKRAERGPSNTAGGRRESPKGGAQEVRQFAAGTGMCLRRTPAAARES